MVNGNSCYYFNIPSSIFQVDLTRNAILVYIALASFTSRKDNKCYPSISTLSKMIKLDRKYIYKAINELVSAGLLTVEKRRGRTNIYELIPPKNPKKVKDTVVKDRKEKKKVLPSDLLDELKEFELSENDIKRVENFYIKNGEEYVRSAILYTKKRAKENKSAYLMQALENDWAKNVRAKQEEQNRYERAKEEYKRFIGKVIVTENERYIVEESSIYRENDNSAIPLGDILKNWDKWRPFLEKKATETGVSGDWR